MGKLCSETGSLPPAACLCSKFSAIFFSSHRSTEFYCIYLNYQPDNCPFDETAISKSWDKNDEDKDKINSSSIIVQDPPGGGG